MFNKLLVSVTAALFLLSLCLGRLFRPDEFHAIDTSRFPRLGHEKAPIEMVVFEDLRCIECREFHLNVLPSIRQRYIDTGKVHCAFVLLAFLENSPPLARTALAIFEKKPDLFFSFVDLVYQQELPAESTGGECLAKLPKLKIENSSRFDLILQENERLGEKLMKENFGTPTVFINGVEVKTLSVESLESEIEKALRGL
jgi:protein-disulfide isomerase